MAGIAMVAMACLLATDPDYPIPRRPREPKPTAAAPPAPAPSPRPLQPRGEIERSGLSDLVMRWQWTGAERPFRVQVLDRLLRPVWTSPPMLGTELVPPPELISILDAGGVFFWRVGSAGGEADCRCSPVLFEVIGGVPSPPR